MGFPAYWRMSKTKPEPVGWGVARGGGGSVRYVPAARYVAYAASLSNCCITVEKCILFRKTSYNACAATLAAPKGTSTEDRHGKADIST